jgi:hypothetical protein
VWRDKQEINHSGGLDNSVTVVFDEGMNDE